MSKPLNESTKLHLARENFLTQVHYAYQRAYETYERDGSLWIDIRAEAEKAWDEHDNPIPADVVFKVTGR